MKEPKPRYRYELQGAHEAGERRHPQVVIREWFPDARSLQPESIADCWLFTASPREDAPGYFVRL